MNIRKIALSVFLCMLFNVFSLGAAAATEQNSDNVYKDAVYLLIVYYFEDKHNYKKNYAHNGYCN